VAVLAVVVLLVLWALTPLAWYLAAVIGAVLSAAAIWWWHRGTADRVLAGLDAVPADERDQAQLHNLVEGLCLSFGVERPLLHVVADASPNAASLAVRDRSHLVVTTGLLERLGRIELEAIVAHELAHIRSGDASAATTAVAVIGYPLLGGDGPLGRALGAVGSALGGGRDGLWRWALGQERELSADLAAVGVTRYPPGLYRALSVIRDDATPLGVASAATVPLWIDDPLARTSAQGRATRPVHPPIDERIDVLGEL
jgi:heat shock protein HtpX